MNRALPALATGLLFLLPGLAPADEMPAFGTDAEADLFLRQHSAFYATMAAQVDARGGLRFTPNPGHPHAGDIHWENGQRCLALGAELAGAERVSIIAFEMTNAYQEGLHQEIDARARQRLIQHPEEFGLRHEMVEYDGLRLHRKVLAELEGSLHGLPAGMLKWISPQSKILEQYELPLATAYLEAQARSGHTAHYLHWFWIQRGEPEPGDAKERPGPPSTPPPVPPPASR